MRRKRDERDSNDAPDSRTLEGLSRESTTERDLGTLATSFSPSILCEGVDVASMSASNRGT